MFVALGIQHEMRVRHIVICGLSDSTKFVHVISQTARFSKKKKVTEHKMRVVISTNLSEIFFTLRRNEQDNIINVYWSSCKVPVIIVRLLMKQEFSRQFRKILKY